MPDMVVAALLVISVALLLAALIPVRQTVLMLSRGVTRTTWIGLSWLLASAALGELAFLGVNLTEGPNHHEDWLIALFSLLGAIFILTASFLSLRTATDVARIASLELAASIDPVTELYNRRHILALLDAECRRSIESRAPLSILLVDIDRFKVFNDTYGHQSGDLVLKEIGAVLARAVPDSRCLGRIGGEEFLVLLPGLPSNEAAHVAERMRAFVEATEIMEAQQPVASLSVSIGVATAYGWQETSEELVAIADEALYAAKELGRNRVCHAFEPTRKRAASRLTFVSRPGL